MPSSDSEDFESADEGHSNLEKVARKKRLSSSNYSDNALETEPESKNHQAAVKESTDGWDDFEIDENEEHVQNVTKDVKDTEALTKNSSEAKPKENVNTKDTGWDDFDDWGTTDTNQPVEVQPKSQMESNQAIKEVTDRLAATSTNSSWGWGWGVDSLLSTATAGISTLSNQVSQGISTVLETSIGAPDPEELARQKAKAPEQAVEDKLKRTDGEESERTNDAFQFGSLISGVTKFVETTGTKVLNSGLDTLETIGKKTMEVLQDGDPGLAKKRAMLGLETDKLVLSQVLREAKAKAEEEDRIREEKKEAKEVHYENLFDDFEGLVHLEALEMLSKQVSMRIEERLRGVQPDQRHEIKETLQQVAELCEMPEEDEEDEHTEGCKADVFHERLQTATQDLGLKLQFSALVKQYTDIVEWCERTDSVTDKVIYKRGVSGLAQATALSMELYHKSGEMLLVKTRRSTADEADALTQMTVVLTKHISDIATLFTEKLNSLPTENKEQINNCITNIFLEAGNSSTYIQNAFQLALPILQIGAV